MADEFIRPPFLFLILMGYDCLNEELQNDVTHFSCSYFCWL